MRLKLPQLKFDESLREFDRWLTPSLGDIKDTEQFEIERGALCHSLEMFGKAAQVGVSDFSVNTDD